MDINIIQTGSKGNMIKLNDGHTSIFLECGLHLSKLGKLAINLGDVRGCLLSHSHADHSKAADSLVSLGITIYTAKKTAEALNLADNYFVKYVKTRQMFEIGTFKIRPFPLQHDAADPLGFFIYSKLTKERLIFATDTYYIQPTFPNLNYIIVECSYIDRLLEQRKNNLPYAYVSRLHKSHLSLDMLLDYLEKTDLSKVEGIYIVHVSEQVGDKKLIKRQVMRKTGLPVYI